MRHRCVSVTVQPACHPSIPLPSLRLNASQISLLESERPCTMSSCLLLKLDACASLRIPNSMTAACRRQSSRHPTLLPCCSFPWCHRRPPLGSELRDAALPCLSLEPHRYASLRLSGGTIPACASRSSLQRQLHTQQSMHHHTASYSG